MKTLSNAFDLIENEIWNPIPFTMPIYYASNMGRVKAGDRWGINRGYPSFRKEKLIKGHLVNGYLKCGLFLLGRKRVAGFHQLIAMAFLGHIPNKNKLVINHIDGNPLNNNISNLEIVTSRYNTIDGYRRCKRKSCVNVGINYRLDRKYYRTYIYINGTVITFNGFKSEEEAKPYYDAMYNNIDKYDGDNTKFKNYIKTIINQ